MITEEQKEFLKKLIDTPTPTGSEAAGALLLGRRIREKTGIAPSIDVHGNLHAVLDVGAKTTVMLEGHGDEIGYVVQYIDDRGYVYLQNLGGIVVPLTAAERLVILTKNGPVRGVVGTRPPHLMKAEEKKSVAADELRLMPCDIGASSREEAEALISVGDDVKSVGDVKLGKGGALSIGPIYHKGLVAYFRKTAEEREIPMQIHAVPKGTGNNGWALKLERGGVPVVQIAVPLRYMHSPVEVADLRDVESVIDLTAAGVAGLDDDFPLLPEQP